MVSLVGVKGRTKYGYALKTGEELEREIQERLARGEKIIKCVYEPFDAYIKHLKRNKIEHVVIRNKCERLVIVKIDDRFKPFNGIIGLAEVFYKLEDNEDINSAVEYFLSLP